MNEIEKGYAEMCKNAVSNRFFKDGVDNASEFEFIAQALQEKLERENPKPLTLEEVIEMPGEPVWCCYEKENKEIITDCRLVSWGAFGCIGIDEKYLLFREYGAKWMAYRHEPKDVEHISEATNMVEGE